jgi:uncharacterized protein
VVIADVRVEGFANGIWAENQPKLHVRDSVFQNNLVGARLEKADTFIFQNVAIAAADVTGETWGYILEPSTLYGGMNFGGIIDLGEYGDLDHFLLCTHGSVSVRQVNIERVMGSYVVRIGQNGRVFWEAGRLNNDPATGVQCFFQLDSTASTFQPGLELVGEILVAGSGWRQVEIFGTYNYACSVKGSSLERIYTATAFGTAQNVAKINGFPTTRLNNSTPSAARRGLFTYVPANESTNGHDGLTVCSKLWDNSFREVQLLNDLLMRIPQVAWVEVGNGAGVETELFKYDYPAYRLPGVGWTFRLHAFGTFAANANNKRIRVRIIDSTDIYDTSSLAINGDSWELDVTVTMTSSNTRTVARMATNSALITNRLQVTDVARTFAQNSWITINATGTGANDVVLKHAKVYIVAATT